VRLLLDELCMRNLKMLSVGTLARAVLVAVCTGSKVRAPRKRGGGVGDVRL
jgi:hypothetical protein